MTLDLSQVQPQVEAMASRLLAEGAKHEERAQRALALLRDRALAWEDLERKRRASRITWLAAGLEEPPDARYPPPAPPPTCTVLAVDGSHIQVDRHAPARCFLLNIGVARLRYGAEPQALLASHPLLYSGEGELALVDPQGTDAVPIEGPVLGARRMVEELAALASWAESSPRPALALVDGTLILWGLEGYPDWVEGQLLDEGIIPALGRLRALAPQGLALASYISRPRSAEVVSLLRLALCPHDPANCDRYCPRPVPRPCQDLAGLEDRYLFRQLQPGERSATFGNYSRVVTAHYGEHRLRFFYLQTGEEMARVEFPAWADASLVHALVWQQVGRGQGYPVALSEAHEQAVIGAGDRDNFWCLVEGSLEGGQLPLFYSAKSQSKKRRWL